MLFCTDFYPPEEAGEQIEDYFLSGTEEETDENGNTETVHLVELSKEEEEECRSRVDTILEKLPEIVQEKNVTIGILTTPLQNAQKAADELIACGIKGIANFSLAHLQVPKDVTVTNIDLAAAIAVLSHRVSVKEKNL